MLIQLCPFLFLILIFLKVVLHIRLIRSSCWFKSYHSCFYLLCCYASNFSCKQDLSFPVCSECALFSCLQQGQQGVTSEHSDILNFYLGSCSPLLLSLPAHYLHPTPALCSLTELFVQAMLGGVSCSEGHPVWKLIPHVTFFYRRIDLNWGYINMWYA